jgi:hypothetical protein
MIPVTRRGRVRRVAKWAGLVVCLLIAAWWFLSYAWSVSCVDGGRALGRLLVSKGLIHLTFVSDAAAYEQHPSPKRRGWRVDRTWRFDRAAWWPGLHSFPYVLSGTTLTVHTVWIPMWMPAVAVALPTAWRFWRDRRARPGHCKCGYDLAGLAPGAPCPECGAAAERRHKTSRGA